MNYEKTLEDLGLSKQESAIYVTSLKLGEAPASTLAKTAGLKRTTVYPILKSLAKQGLIMVNIRKNERYYRPQNPSTLAKRYEKVLEGFTAIIPQLSGLRQKQAPSFGVRFLETADEIKQFYLDVLVNYKNSEYYVIGSSKEWMGIDEEFFYQFRERRRADREQANIQTKLILTHDSKQVDPPNGSLLRRAKYLPTSYKFKSSINIFEKEILILGPGLISMAVVIEIPAMTDIFKSIFQILWDMLPNEDIKKNKGNQ